KSLALAAVVGTAVCGSGGHSDSGKAAAAKPVAVASSGLTGKIVFRRFLNDTHSHSALFVMNADGTGIQQITRPPVTAVDSLNGPPSPLPDGSALIFDRSTP